MALMTVATGHTMQIHLRLTLLPPGGLPFPASPGASCSSLSHPGEHKVAGQGRSEELLGIPVAVSCGPTHSLGGTEGRRGLVVPWGGG